jgi:hypothetical protein
MQDPRYRWTYPAWLRGFLVSCGLFYVALALGINEWHGLAWCAAIAGPLIGPFVILEAFLPAVTLGEGALEIRNFLGRIKSLRLEEIELVQISRDGSLRVFGHNDQSITLPRFLGSRNEIISALDQELETRGITVEWTDF